jgi:hypothetical protein
MIRSDAVSFAMPKVIIPENYIKQSQKLSPKFFKNHFFVQ